MLDCKKQSFIKGNKGFSLVEMAVVIIVIGILIAGVIKGKELVLQSRLQTYAEDFLKLRSHLALFKDQYETWPSDVTREECEALGWATSGANCSPHLASASRAKTIFSNASNDFWLQILQAYPSFINGEESAARSRDFYPAIWSFRTHGTSNLWRADYLTTDLWAKERGNHLLTTGDTNYVGALRASEALAIDRKVDDGVANSGAIYGFSSSTSGSDKCSAAFNTAASTDDYGDGANTGAEDDDACGLLIFLDEWE